MKFDAKFIATVDKLIMHADKDKELLEAIKWADNESRESGISFYEAFYNLIAILHSFEQGAKEWLDNGGMSEYLPQI